jgi:predicted house-cleaning noncanonical NTP pyrophosphatase (MazG superfamily)
MKRREKLPERIFAPLNPVTYIGAHGAGTLARESILPENIGWKAYGLSSVPPEWVPSFLVISADCFTDAEAEQKATETLGRGLDQANVKSPLVKLRSSGTAETIQYRGRLISCTCTPDKIIETIKSLTATLQRETHGKIHWIVQEYIEPIRQGHLSNERRVSKEKRDWVAEVELKEESPGYSIPIAVRRWRDGARIADSSLGCKSEIEISFCLKRVALWAERLPSRMHFEWLWTGNSIKVVQADLADSDLGVDPASLVPIEISLVSVDALSSFKTATPGAYELYAKLRNAKLYRELGYEMPTFYVLDDQHVLSVVLAGTVPVALRKDLEELTKRPLILRTDGIDIPTKKREMLPRSEELRTASEAEAWLLDHFKTSIDRGNLQHSSLCLIGHHFIPSAASAWARAEPGKRFVRIEGLWGLPEGLYWYSHDTYEVDTKDIAIKPQKPGTLFKYDYWERLRFKGTFIAPDKEGKWIPYQTKIPFDWRSCINKRNWLFEIAHTTRLIAEQEKFPVAVMWFIANHESSTSHSVLPWFHTRSELTETPRAAPRRKLTAAGDFRLRNSTDWENLKKLVEEGKPVERTIVEPTDCDLIRNPDFVRDLAEFARLHRIVIELAGGVLTHAYYILQREEAQVECTDLFGAEEDVVEYNKLVRDKIPAIIEAKGERVETVLLNGDALIAALRQKLVEEALEALDAKSGDDLVGELADVEEVITGLRHALRLSKGQVETERLEKQKRRGGFQRGYMLTKTTSPHSLPKEPTTPRGTLYLELASADETSISRTEDIPATPTYRRPDFRQIEEDVEKIFVFETEIKKATDLGQTVNFTLPTNSDGTSREFSLTVEISRRGASLRSRVRLRVRPTQLLIDFPDSQLKFDFRK